MNWYKKASLTTIINKTASVGYRQIAYADGPAMNKIDMIMRSSGEEDVISYMLNVHRNEGSIGAPPISGDEFIYERDNYVLAYNPGKYVSVTERVPAAEAV